MATAVASAGEEEVQMTPDDIKDVGLVDAHAYSLIKVAEVKIFGKETAKLLQIRNPWGKHEWTGDWSDKSSLWTSDAKK
jgi:hypothetical protein